MATIGVVAFVESGLISGVLFGSNGDVTETTVSVQGGQVASMHGLHVMF